MTKILGATRRPPRHSNVLIGTLGWAGALVFFFPIGYMILKSFQTEEIAASSTPQVVFKGTLSNYHAAFNQGFLGYAFHSVLVVAISTSIVIIFAIPAAYALSIKPVQKSQDVLFFFISTKMMPIAAGIIPIYVVASKMGLLNGLPILVVMMFAMNIPLGVWMLRSFMQDIPPEILEAAEVDGASRWRVLRSVVYPLIRPGIASTALLAAVFAWNDFFFAVNLTSSNSTLPLFLQKFLSFGQLYTAHVAAVATLASLPVIIMGWLAQKSLVRGLLFGAVK